jgi:hypothetical protein
MTVVIMCYVPGHVWGEFKFDIDFIVLKTSQLTKQNN